VSYFLRQLLDDDLDHFYYFVCSIQSQPFHKFVSSFRHQLLYEIILIISTLLLLNC